MLNVESVPKKHFYLLQLFPCGNFSSGNKVLAEFDAYTFYEAVEYFRNNNLLGLNPDGYIKYGDITYCVAERHS